MLYIFKIFTHCMYTSIPFVMRTDVQIMKFLVRLFFSQETLFSGTYTTLKTFVLITTDRTDTTWNFECVLMVVENKNEYDENR